MKLLLIQGANMEYLGIREPQKLHSSQHGTNVPIEIEAFNVLQGIHIVFVLYEFGTGQCQLHTIECSRVIVECQPQTDHQSGSC